jgi:clan AA aspartic protease (TIGR02281 family)
LLCCGSLRKDLQGDSEEIGNPSPSLGRKGAAETSSFHHIHRKERLDENELVTVQDVVVWLPSPGASPGRLAYGQEDIAKYPSRPITYIQPFTAGSSTDLAIRLLAKATEKTLDDVVRGLTTPAEVLQKEYVGNYVVRVQQEYLKKYIPEKYRQDAETRKPSQETSAPQILERPKSSPPAKTSEPEGITVDLVRKGELSLAEVVLNGRIKQYFIVDTGASFTLINRVTAKELGITIDENTPYMPIFTASSLIFTPLVTLQSVRVGNAEVENVEALIYSMPGSGEGLLGNSFLNKFKVVIDSMNGKMTLYPMQGTPSPDRPGGYGKDYWIGQFRFYNRNL